MVTRLKKGARVTGAAREKLTIEFKGLYASGMSIRTIEAQTGRSYGFIHRLLDEAGVEFRGRGGTRGSKKKTSAVTNGGEKEGT